VNPELKSLGFLFMDR